MTRRMGVLALVFVAVAGATQVSADETDTAAPIPVLGTSSARFGAGSAGSLAEVARQLRLAKPEGQGVMEVNDLNLGEVAASGAISVAEGATVSAGPAQRSGAEGGETRIDGWEKRFDEQVEAVAAAEELLAKIDEHRSQPTDPYMPRMGPHGSAPGAISPGQQQRDEAARALAEEQAKLDALRKEGRRLGVRR